VIGEKNLGIWLKASQFIGAKLGFNLCPSGLFPVISQGLEFQTKIICLLEPH
jgi:hypothetical protein